jgi:hypothetical protein
MRERLVKVIKFKIIFYIWLCVFLGICLWGALIGMYLGEDNPLYQVSINIAALTIGILLLLYIIISIINKGILQKMAANPAAQQQTQLIRNDQPDVKEIFVGRGGVWEVNTFVYKVKLQNTTGASITDLNVIIDRFPSMMKLDDAAKVKSTQIMYPNGLWTPEFKFQAGNDCISGVIHSIVTYFDPNGKRHSIEVRGLEISYICPLLEARPLNELDYLRTTRDMKSQETKIPIDDITNINQALADIKNRMQDMNLAIVSMGGQSNQIMAYGVDRVKNDGLALEAKIQQGLEGQTELIIKSLCEYENKCAALLNKGVQELSIIGLSVEKNEILTKLNMFIEKPDKLGKYVKRILDSDWPNDQKDKWYAVVQETMEEWAAAFQPSKFQRIAKTLIGVITIAARGSIITRGAITLLEFLEDHI